MKRKPKPRCPVQKKAMFRTQGDAQKALGRIWSHTNENMADLHTYQCPHCKSWHVGHLSYFQQSQVV